MPLTLRAGACSLQGGHRQDNADAVAVDEFPDLVLCQVADGGGGWGEFVSQASQLAIATIAARLVKTGRDEIGRANLEQALRLGIAEAGEAVAALASGEGFGRHSTITLAARR